MKSERSVVLGSLWAFVVGGISGGGIWWITNQIVVNGRSILDRAAWPLNTPVPFVVVGSVLTGISVLRANRRAQAPREELRGVAGELGLTYEEGDVVVPPEARPNTPLFAGWSRCQNRLSGTNDGAAAQMFDLTTVSGAGDGTVDRSWTVVVFEQTHLPAFSCLPDVWWTKVDRIHMSPVNFDPEAGDPMTGHAVAEFQSSYQVCLPGRATATQEEETRRLFRVPLMAALARHSGWFIQAADGCLVFAHRGIAAAAERASLCARRPSCAGLFCACLPRSCRSPLPRGWSEAARKIAGSAGPAGVWPARSSGFSEASSGLPR